MLNVHPTKWTLRLLLKLLDLLHVELLICFSQWKRRYLSAACSWRFSSWAVFVFGDKRWENVGHFLELLQRWSVVIGVDAGIASVAGHSLYAGFNIFSSKNCHCRCSDAMVGQMRRDVIFFIISARDLSPSEELQNQIGSTSGSNFAVPSARGFWKKKSVSGFKWRR